MSDTNDWTLCWLSGKWAHNVRHAIYRKPNLANWMRDDGWGSMKIDRTNGMSISFEP
jgi:hypothetical protein